MTFTELVSAVQERLNLTSTESATRIGGRINDRYRRVTSSIGVNLSRRATFQQTASIGISTITFTTCEKLINVVDRSATPYRVLDEVTVEQLRASQPYTSSSTPRKYAIILVDAHAVTIELDCVPQTGFTLYADGYNRATTLSGSQEPAFEEDFHDILYHGALADEYRKVQMKDLAREAEQMYENRLSDLRMFRAKSSYLDIMQNGNQQRSVGPTGGSGGSGSSTNGASSYTQTGLITFDRTSALVGSRYPFAVAAGSEKVANLDADKLDGLDSTAFDILTSDQTISGLKTFDRGAAVPFAVAAASLKVTNLDADKLDGIDSTGFARVGAATPAGDIFTTALLDYSATSTIVGWASFTTKSIFIKKIGRFVMVFFSIAGTSNSVTTSFTVPDACNASIGANMPLAQGKDNSVFLTVPGLINMSGGSAVISFFTTQAAGSWTNANTKSIVGNFFYEAAS